MSGRLINFQDPAAQIDDASFAQRLSPHIGAPLPVQRVQDIGAPPHSAADHRGELGEERNGFGIGQNVPGLSRGVNIQPGPLSFQERRQTDVIEMGMQDNQMLDLSRVNSPVGQLLKKIRQEIAHSGADQSGRTVSFQEIDAGFLRPQKPETVVDPPRFSYSHCFS